MSSSQPPSPPLQHPAPFLQIQPCNPEPSKASELSQRENIIRLASSLSRLSQQMKSESPTKQPRPSQFKKSKASPKKAKRRERVSRSEEFEEGELQCTSLHKRQRTAQLSTGKQSQAPYIKKISLEIEPREVHSPSRQSSRPKVDLQKFLESQSLWTESNRGSQKKQKQSTDLLTPKSKPLRLSHIEFRRADGPSDTKGLKSVTPAGSAQEQIPNCFKCCQEHQGKVYICDFQTQNFMGCGNSFCHAHGIPPLGFADHLDEERRPSGTSLHEAKVCLERRQAFIQVFELEGRMDMAEIKLCQDCQIKFLDSVKALSEKKGPSTTFIMVLVAFVVAVLLIGLFIWLEISRTDETCDLDEDCENAQAASPISCPPHSYAEEGESGWLCVRQVCVDGQFLDANGKCRTDDYANLRLFYNRTGCPLYSSFSSNLNQCVSPICEDARSFVSSEGHCELCPPYSRPNSERRGCISSLDGGCQENEFLSLVGECSACPELSIGMEHVEDIKGQTHCQQRPQLLEQQRKCLATEIIVQKQVGCESPCLPFLEVFDFDRSQCVAAVCGQQEMVNWFGHCRQCPAGTVPSKDLRACDLMK